LKVKLSIPSVCDIELSVPSTASIGFVKRKACQKLGIEPDLTSIICDGTRIDDNRRVGALQLEQKTLTIDYLWARHLILWGSNGQKRLREATVLVAGAGAIGNEVAKNLAMLGVKRLLFVDNDVVELSNTSRMIFFDRKNQGLNKAQVLARGIVSKFPYVEAIAWTGSLEDLPLEHLLSADVIVCGLDNVVSRIYLSQVSRRYSIPMIDGGIVGYRGRVQVYVPPNMPCPLCMYPSGEYGRIVGLRNPCDGPAEETKVPSLPTTISLVSSIQCQEAMKLIVGHQSYLKNGTWPKETGEPLKGILMIDLQYNRYSIMDVKRSKTCIVCGDNGLVQKTVPILTIPVKDLHDSTSQLHEIVAHKMKVVDGQIMLFSERRKKTARIEKKKSLRRLHIGAGSIITVVAQNGTDYAEAVVRLSRS
jgi:molybdopterin/thiamine biosynthesis adenylyltransferase